MWILCGALGVCAPDLWGKSRALADGAFPASQSVLLPTDRPKEIILAANFGLIFSEDDGGSWAYACENLSATANASAYRVGPAPNDRIYALSPGLGVAVSADGACTWSLGGGDLVNTTVSDVFADPGNPNRVFALAVPQSGASPATGIYHSEDGGLTYAMSAFATPAGASITGIEVATTDPTRVFATLDGSADGSRPQLARSTDGGASFVVHDLSPALGAVNVRLVAVDPTDAAAIFLRLLSAPGVTPAGEALAVSRDGGDTWTTPLTVAGGSIVGFARLPTGTLAVLATSPSGPELLRSNDGGATFTSTPVTFVPTGLASRAGVLFAAANEFPAGESNPNRFSLASSADEGETWQARLKFNQISGVRACVKAACQASCSYLAGLTLFPAAACTTAASSGSGGGAGGGAAAGSGSGGGCSYGLAAQGFGGISRAGGAAAALVSLAAAWRRRRRRMGVPRSSGQHPDRG